MVTEAEALQAASDLAAWLTDRTFGSIRVLRATADLDTDSDDVTSIFIDLLVSNPAPPNETWPVDDTLDLRRELLAKVRERDLGLPVYARLTPQSADTDELRLFDHA